MSKAGAVIVKFPRPQRSAAAIAEELVAALEQARDAESRGERNLAAGFNERALDLRDALADTPAYSRADRLAHTVEAGHVIAELLTPLVREIVAKGLSRKASVLIRLMARIDVAQAEDAPAT